MPSYFPIRRWMDGAEKARTAERLLALRHKLKSEITDRAGRNALLIATWNLRDFDASRLGHGPRLRESFYYIAEIASAFDLVVLQEVSRNLEGLEALLSILGQEWDYFATDTIEGDRGSDERMAYLYRRSKIGFRRIAGEVVLPGGQVVAPRGGLADPRKEGELQFVRTPFLAAFQAGGLKFNLCTIHIRYSGTTAQDLQRHTAHLEGLARFFRERQDREREDYILLGDFGIGAPGDLMAKVLERNGFDVPEALGRRRAGLDGGKFYDQIAFRTKEDRLELARAGAFRFFDVVFRDNDEDFAAYEDLMPEDKANDLWNGGPRGYYANQWRTWQMSDHVPLWVELKVDFSDHYLEAIRRSAAPG
jgi:endonuclease/exonuclease/phosphatase family metal-dependent hydrolase